MEKLKKIIEQFLTFHTKYLLCNIHEISILYELFTLSPAHPFLNVEATVCLTSCKPVTLAKVRNASLTSSRNS